MELRLVIELCILWKLPRHKLKFSSMPHSNLSLLTTLTHELRQPLSTIESIAYYLELALPNADPRVVEQLTRLRHLVAQSGWILSDAMTLAQPPSARPHAVDLDELITEFVLEHSQAEPDNDCFALDLAASPVWIDLQQGRQLVQTICRFFAASLKPGGKVSIDTRVLASGSVMLRARAEGQTGEDAKSPAGAGLTLDAIEHLADENAASVLIRLSDPSRLELSMEIPAAPLRREWQSAFLADEMQEQAVPSTL